MLKKSTFFSFWWIVGKVKKNVNQASFIQTHITQCYLKSYICLNIIVNDSFFWKNSWAPTCPWPRPFKPPSPLCWNGFYLDIARDTKCNIIVLTLLSNFKTRRVIFKIYVAFSHYLNFCILYLLYQEFLHWTLQAE